MKKSVWLVVIGMLFLCSLVFSVRAEAQESRIVGWGYHVYPYVPEGTEFTSISAGVTTSLALAKDGKVYAWGRNDNGQCNVLQEIQGRVKLISAGSRQGHGNFTGLQCACGR